ncbi:hypothetical protein CgunFtcFv8_025565 [Champsocephalus gunnari]|uniref:Uncharacterized protein n=1 Tax=Champsocephalus gunnari TaxID=52237 RepID=A0AAN8H2E2_CHAGU|nr:hypothetical protein CgunFtcFv8_025565 [Champsocephalus gunnari]
MRLLSRSAHGWAEALIIDVVENVRRQETKLPAVPPHYDIISEGWRPAAAYPITEPSAGMSRGELGPTVDKHSYT